MTRENSTRSLLSAAPSSTLSALASLHGPPGDIGMCGATLVEQDFILCTGGSCRLGPHGDRSSRNGIHAYHIRSGVWCPVLCGGVPAQLPFPLQGHATVSHGAQIWIIGGLSNSGAMSKSILHLKLGIDGVPSHENGAHATIMPSVIVEDARSYPLLYPCLHSAYTKLVTRRKHTPYIFMVGGLTIPRNDDLPGESSTPLLTYTNRAIAVDLDEMRLRHVVQRGDVPPPRAAAALVTLEDQTRVVLFGGRHEGTTFRDLYVGDVQFGEGLDEAVISIQWREFRPCSPAAVWPGARYGHTLTVVPSTARGGTSIVLSGGQCTALVAAIAPPITSSRRTAPAVEEKPPSFSVMYFLLLTAADASWSETGVSVIRSFHSTFIDWQLVSHSSSSTVAAAGIGPESSHSSNKSQGGPPQATPIGLLLVGGSTAGNPVRHLPLDLSPSRVADSEFVHFSVVMAGPNDSPNFSSPLAKDLHIPRNELSLAGLRKEIHAALQLDESSAESDLLIDHCPTGSPNDRRPIFLDKILDRAIQDHLQLNPNQQFTIATYLDSPPMHYTKMRQVGKGSYGVVWMAMNSEDSSLFALKVVAMGSDSNQNQLQTEISIMRQLRHENIVRYLGARPNESAGEMHIFMEFISGSGTLAEICTHVIPLRQVQLWIRQVLHALQFLHKYQFAHRDLKGANVLLAADGVVKLADFGTIKMINPDSMTKQHNMVGSCPWMAPEVMRGECSTTASDIWSLGCLVIELVTGVHPYHEKEFQSIIQIIYHVAQSANPPEIPSELPESAKAFLARCLVHDPAKRPTASDLLRDPFITEIFPPSILVPRKAKGSGFSASPVNAPRPGSSAASRPGGVAPPPQQLQPHQHSSPSSATPPSSSAPSQVPKPAVSSSVDRTDSWPTSPEPTPPKFPLVAAVETAEVLARPSTNGGTKGSSDTPPQPPKSSTSSSSTMTAANNGLPPRSTPATAAAHGKPAKCHKPPQRKMATPGVAKARKSPPPEAADPPGDDPTRA